MLFFSSLISSPMHTSFLKVEVTGFLSCFPLSTRFLHEAKLSLFCRIGGTCWASATAVAERKHGQMAPCLISCLSMAGNTSDIYGVSGRAGRVLPAPMFSVAGCTCQGQHMVHGTYRESWTGDGCRSPTVIQGMSGSAGWHQPKCHTAKCVGVLLRGDLIAKKQGRHQGIKNTEPVLCPT